MLKLLSRRNFGLLWTGSLISLTGDWFLFTGLPLFIFTLTGSTLATGGLFVAQIIPALLFGSVSGVFVDRWDRKHIVVCVNFTQALIMLPLLLVDTPEKIWLVYFMAVAEIRWPSLHARQPEP